MGTRFRPKKAPSVASQFPDEVLHQIFLRVTDTRALCYASEVCKQWHRVCMSDGTIWKRLRLSQPYSTDYTGKKRKRKPKKALEGISQAIEVMTTRASGCLTELDFEHVVESQKPAKQADLLKIKNHAKDTLEVLKLRGRFVVSIPVVVDIISSCSNLRVLHTPHLKSMRFNVLRKIVQCCRKLEDISLEHCTGFRCFDTLALGAALIPTCRTLRKINFSFTAISGLPLLRFGHEFPRLEEIYADACQDLMQDFPLLGGAVIENDFFPRLTTFSVNAAKSFSVHWVQILFRAERKLRYFAMNFTRILNLNLVFAGQLPCLSVVGLAGQSLCDEMWQQIFNTLHPTLEVCDLRLNRKLTGALCVEAIGGRKFTQLVSLDFGETSISDENVHQIMELAPKLETFRLRGCRSVINRQLRRDPLKMRTANTLEIEDGS